MEMLGFLTQRGEALLAQALSGKLLLTVTRVAAGSGMTSSSATALAQERQALAAERPYRSMGGVVVPAVLVSALAERAYTLWEVGVYVQDGQGESLFAVYRMAEPMDVLPDSTMSVTFFLEECFGQEAEVSVTAANILTRQELELLRNAPGGFAGLDDTAAVAPAQMPYTCGTEELEPGVTPLPDGRLHFVYE